MALTSEQEAVLESMRAHRITAVRAVPGAGKTTVFVEVLARELDGCKAPRSGIAALSFTNAAHELVTSRLGARLNEPHFVGTLDSFLWRFIVRPFASAGGYVSSDGPRLIVAAVSPHSSWTQIPFPPGTDARVGLDQFELRWNAGSSRFEVLVDLDYRPGLTSVDAATKERVVREKKASWQRTGRMTHGDANAVALALMQKPIGVRIRQALAHRFSVLLVDEFQDTTSAQAAVICSILGETHMRALVVGDPDQAVFGFGGADRHIFARIESIAGCTTASIRRTHRFGPGLVNVAGPLTRSAAELHTERPVDYTSVTLVVHRQKGASAAVRPILERVGMVQSGTTAVLARKRSVLERLRGEEISLNRPKLSAKWSAIADGCEALVKGDTAKATAIWEHFAAEILLDGEETTRLPVLGIPRSTWRREIRRALRESALERENESWAAWVERCRAAFDGIARRLNLTHTRTVRQRLPSPTDETLSGARRLPAGTPSVYAPAFLTVHKAKGREFETVVFYCEKPTAQSSPCPSKAWWSEDEDEMETAFVAVTRATRRLILCVHQQTFEALVRLRPGFVDAFGQNVVHLEPDAPAPRRRRRSPSNV